MTTDETPDDAPPTGAEHCHEAGADQRRGRRRFLRLSGSAFAVSLAGCSSLGVGGDSGDDEPPDDAVGSTPANRGNETDGPTATETPTDDGSTGAESNATETGTPADLHEHGYLYLVVDGERQPFTDPKYYQPGEHPDAEATDRFHFHDDGHDFLWHMHGERLTLAAALGELPDVAYESADGAHVIRYEGETYEDGQDGTSVDVRRGEQAIDPTAYELRDGDEIWIEIATGDGS